MPNAEADLLAIRRGMVTAPAGCGKTHLIGEALKGHSASKPVLILTHTNAGVFALRSRLDEARVPSKAYRLSTIDGWAMRLISRFPARSGHDLSLLHLANPRVDYPNIRVAAMNLLNSGHVSDVLAATYAHVIVDEYQDCTFRQHCIILGAAQILPTCVLGDHMQAIFGFGGDPLPRWEQVCAAFPVVAELTVPWRWINSGARPLGVWLLEVRARLARGEPIDLSAAPVGVMWIKLDGTADHQRRLLAARIRPPTKNGHVLIIGDCTNPESQRQFVGQTPGAVAVEAVDLKDFVLFARSFDVSAPNALELLARFAQRVMTNMGAADLVRRVQSLAGGRAKNPPSEAGKVRHYGS